MSKSLFVKSFSVELFVKSADQGEHGWKATLCLGIVWLVMAVLQWGMVGMGGGGGGREAEEQVRRIDVVRDDYGADEEDIRRLTAELDQRQISLARRRDMAERVNMEREELEILVMN